MDGLDSRGVKRGSCLDCSCDGYDGGSEKRKCIRCTHPPGKHKNVNSSSASNQSSRVFAPSPPLSNGSEGNPASVFVPKCLFRGCTEERDFDPNTGDDKHYCRLHLENPATLNAQGVGNGINGIVSNSNGNFAGSLAGSSSDENGDGFTKTASNSIYGHRMVHLSTKRSTAAESTSTATTTPSGASLLSGISSSSSSWISRGLPPNQTHGRSKSAVLPPALVRPSSVAYPPYVNPVAQNTVGKF